MRVGIIDRSGASFKNKILTTLSGGETWCGPSGRHGGKNEREKETWNHICCAVYSPPGSATRLGIIDRTR